MRSCKEAWEAIDSDLKSSSVLASLETTDSPDHGEHSEDAGPRRSSLHIRIVQALRNSRDQQLGRRAERINGCCSTPAIYLTDEGLPKLVMGCCRDRLCPRCQRLRGRECTRKTTAIVQGMNTARFITMGLKDDGQPLKQRLNRLAKSFRRLRKDPWFSKNCIGGVYGIETTRGRHGQHWHVHLHIIAEGDYMDQATLSEAWKRATGDSDIVHIKAVHDRGAQARYIAEYVSKPTNALSWSDRELAEYALATHGRRLIHTFGTLHGKKVEPAEPRSGGKPTKMLLHCRTLKEHADHGDERAQHAVSIAARMSPLWAATLGLKHHATAVGLSPVEKWEVEKLVDVCKALHEELFLTPPPPTDAPQLVPLPPPPGVDRGQMCFANS